MHATKPSLKAAAPDLRELRHLHRAGLLSVLLIAAIVVVGVATLEYTSRWVQHTREVLRTVRELQTSLLQVESRALQSALSRSSGDNAVFALRPSTAAVSPDTATDRAQLDITQPTRADIDAQVARLLALTSDNQPQQERARQLAASVERWAAERAQLPRAAASAAVDAPTAALQQVLQEFQAEESDRYGRRVAWQQRWRATLVIVVMGALALVAFVLQRMTRNVLREVGTRVRAEAERDRAQVLLDFALDRSPLAVAVLEPDNSLRIANDAWRAMEPAVRTPSVGEGRLAAELEAVVAEVRRTGEPAVTEIVVADARETDPAAFDPEAVFRPAGPAPVLLVSAHRIEPRQDSAVGVVLLDRTEQRWLETQLRHAQRMEALGRLAGGVAHDINNVVTAIIGFTDMAILALRSLSESALAPASQDDITRSRAVPRSLAQMDADLQQVRRAADRAAVMARQLLSFSRQRMNQARPLDVSEVVRDIEPMLRRILGSHVQFDVRTDSHGWAVHADPGQIEQVMLNLAINARDAMERGGDLLITVSRVDATQWEAAAARRAWPAPNRAQDPAQVTEPTQGLREGVCLIVQDTGSGIPLAVQARMFDPFFTTKAEGKGTGLGLATVRQILDDLGGFVTIDSAAGKGTTVAVYLPRTTGEPEVLRPRITRGTHPTRAGLVLVADDDRDVRYLMEQVLSDAGFTVHTARGGREALDLIARATAPYRLLITDLVMPELGGVALGSHPQVTAHIGRVLYMSGYPTDSYGQQTTLPEHLPRLAKPFSPAELLAAVDEVMAADAAPKT